MKRKVISIVLLMALLAGVVGLFAPAGADGEQTATRGDYVYSLTADPNTGTVPDGFGTPASNGRIWTDKSVAVNGEKFDVNLKVLAQEYVSSKSDAATSSIAADVVLVLDMSQSMTTNLPKGSSSVQRAAAMADSVNEAIDIITTTNPDNRIAVYSYNKNVTASDAVYCNMPLAHYTSSSTSTSTVDKYVTYSGSTLKSSSTLLKDGVPYSFSQGMSSNGTGTQAGIAHGVKGMVDAINAETDNSIERKPYVIVLTDGEATSASRNWYTEDLSQLRTNYVTTSNGGSPYTGKRKEQIAAATILTSAFWKDKLEEAYNNYNGPGRENAPEWFNIGLGIEGASSPDAASVANCMLNPNYLIDAESSIGGNYRESIKFLLDYDVYAPAYTNKDYFADNNYVYVKPDTGFITFANTYEVLYNAFTTLAEIIQQGTAQITLPIVYHEGSGTSESDVEFTDVIGNGMYVTDITLNLNGVPPIVGDDSDSDGVYTFADYKTTATLTESSTGQQTLKWTIPADEVAMYTFKDRKNVTNGEYISAEPTTLSYSVNITDEIGMGPGYTNEFDGSKVPKTTVTYEIPGDNTYYYDVTTNSTHEFVSGALKSGLDTSTAKTENVTDSNANSSAYAYTAINDNTYEASAEVMVHLGNNGKVSFLAYHNELDIQVVKKWKDINGDEITDTSALPAVTVSLYRTADGSSTPEFVEQKELSNSNSYTTLWNVPRKDSGGHVYSYSVAEDPPDGYYIESNTGPLNGVDGTITVTNRETPASGMVSIQKKWQTKIGTPITDTSSFAGIEAQLWRKVSVYTPAKVNVKVYCQDDTTSYLADDFDVEYGSTVSFKLRAYIRTQANADAAIIRFNNKTVPSTRSYIYRGGYTLHYREVNEAKTITALKDTVLIYTVSHTLNSDQMTLPVELIDLVKTDPTSSEGTTTSAPDELVATETLNTANHWKVYIDDLKSSEVKDDGKTYNYLYYVKEISAVDGFTTSYSANNTAGITGGNLVITNKSTSNIPPLPETGGAGEVLITAVGVLLVSAATVLYSKQVFRERKKRKATNH